MQSAFTRLFDALDSTKRFAVMNSAMEKAATNDAHANWSLTPMLADSRVSLGDNPASLARFQFSGKGGNCECR